MYAVDDVTRRNIAQAIMCQSATHQTELRQGPPPLHLARTQSFVPRQLLPLCTLAHAAIRLRGHCPAAYSHTCDTMITHVNSLLKLQKCCLYDWTELVLLDVRQRHTGHKPHDCQARSEKWQLRQ